MRNLRIVSVFLLSACYSQRWSIKTEYTAQLQVEPPKSPDFECSAREPLVYGQTLTVLQPGPDDPVRTENWAPLPLRLTNRSANIVTVDWDHSAIVDASSNSYHVILFERGQTQSMFEAVKKPPAPVIAPNSHVDLQILPEPRYSGQEHMFFMPPSAQEKSPIRIVLSLSGGPGPYAECIIHARLSGSRQVRSRDHEWPTQDQNCVPHFGCAEGYECVADRCTRSAITPVVSSEKP